MSVVEDSTQQIPNQSRQRVNKVYNIRNTDGMTLTDGETMQLNSLSQVFIIYMYRDISILNLYSFCCKKNEYVHILYILR
jgi:hypothetical protein